MIRRSMKIELALAALSIVTLACGARVNLGVIDFNFGVESAAGNVSISFLPLNRGVSLTKLTTGEVVYQTGSPIAYGGTGWSSPRQIYP